MNLKELQKNWNRFGKQDPLWAIATFPDKKGRKWVPEDFFQLGRGDVAYVFEYLNKLGIVIPRRHALDFGCGVGRLTQALAPNFDDVVGVDIAPSMIKIARKSNRFGDRCRYYLNERDDLALFKDNSFDFVLSRITLQHIHPRYIRRYLAEFLRVLAPQGVLYFELPSRYLGSGDRHGSEDRHAWSDRSREKIEPGQKMRTFVKNATPEPLLRLYRTVRDWKNRTVRDWKNEPIMEMYGIERSEVESLLKQHGGVLLDAVKEPFAGPMWEGFSYCVTKT
jgi:SAM-dependent methyltransferase